MRKLTVCLICGLLIALVLASGFAYSLNLKIVPHGILDVEVSPNLAKLYLGDIQTFVAVVHNGSAPFTYSWYENGSLIEGADASFLHFRLEQTFNYTVLSVFVMDKDGLSGSSSATIIDPFGGSFNNLPWYPSLGLGSYAVFTNSTHFFLQNQTTGNVDLVSTNDDYILQASSDLVDNNVGGLIWVKSGTYSASITVGNNVTMIFETGVKGISYTLAGSTSCVLQWVSGRTFLDNAMYINGNLNMSNHQILFGRFETGASLPTTGLVEGRWFWLTTTHTLYVYDSSSWVAWNTGGGGGGGTLGSMGSYTYICYLNGSNYQFRNHLGTIQYTSTDSSKVVNFAIANCSTGDSVFLKADTFSLPASTGINIGVNGIRLFGEGYGALLSVASGFNDHIIDITGNNVEIDHLRIDGTNQGATYNGIWQEPSSTGLRAHNLIIENCGQDGIRLGDTDASWEASWAKLGPTIVIRNNGEYGIYFTYDATDCELHDFLISGHNGAGDAGICVDSDNIRISTGHLWGNCYEFKLAEGHSVDGLLVSNVGIMDGGGVGNGGQHRIYHTSSNVLRNFQFTGCEIWVAKLNTRFDTYDGFYIVGTAYAGVITSNVFRGNSDSTDYDQRQGRYAINFDASVSNCTIACNSIMRFNQTDPIYTVGATNIQESLNSFYQNGP